MGSSSLTYTVTHLSSHKSIVNRPQGHGLIRKTATMWSCLFIKCPTKLNQLWFANTSDCFTCFTRHLWQFMLNLLTPDCHACEWFNYLPILLLFMLLNGKNWLLFIIKIIDLANLSTILCPMLFVDDTNLYEQTHFSLIPHLDTCIWLQLGIPYFAFQHHSTSDCI